MRWKRSIPPIETAPIVSPWYPPRSATNSVRAVSPRSWWCWKAILTAISTAVAPASEKKTRVSPRGTSAASASAHSIDAVEARPSSVEWAIFPSWTRIASSISGTRCPWTLHHREDTPSR